MDVFFVISGYLITGIGLTDQTSGGFQVRHFYEKRFRRLMPALAFVLVLTLFLSYFFLLPYEFKYFAQSLVSTVAFGSNVFSYLKQGYFDASNEIKPLLHTWSLSLEEQYYFLFPWLLLFFRSGRKLVLILVTLFFFSLGLALAKCAPGSPFNFFLLPMRAWELLAGSLLACLEQEQKPVPFLRHIPNEIAALLLAGCIYFFDSNTPHPGPLTLIPVISSVILLQCRTQKNTVHRLLSKTALVKLGIYSYSFYLVHQPILVFLRIFLGHKLNPPENLLALAGSLLVGYLIWRFVEKPFRKSTVRENPVHFLSVSGVLLILAIAGAYVHLQHGLPYRTLSYRPTAFFNVFSSTDKEKAISKMCGDPSQVCRIHTVPSSDPDKKSLLLLGDSHAQDYLVPFLKFAETSGQEAWLLSIGGCSFVADEVTSECKAARISLNRFFSNHQDIQVIWIENLESHNRYDESGAKSFKNFVSSLNRGRIRLSFFKPRHQFKDPIFLWGTSPRIDLHGDFPVVPSDSEWDFEYSSLKSEQIFDERAELCKISSSSDCSPLEAETLLPLYRDDNHLTPYGAERVFHRFIQSTQ